jgi:predicted P-loop ATPase/GTPase
VDTDRDTVFLRGFAGLLQLLRIERVVRVRPEDGRDARVAILPAIDEAFALRD